MTSFHPACVCGRRIVKEESVCPRCGTGFGGNASADRQITFVVEWLIPALFVAVAIGLPVALMQKVYSGIILFSIVPLPAEIVLALAYFCGMTVCWLLHLRDDH